MNSVYQGVIEKCVSHQTLFKMIHFHTKDYPVHKIVDEYLDSFSTNFDRLVETWKGAYKDDLNIKSLKINIEILLGKEDIIALMNIFIQQMYLFEKYMSKQLYYNNGIDTIIGDMIISSQKLIYLIRLK